ncbi:NUDIX domain-containing protein [Candidatus Dependentiae bacterium]|nr:NUDIX domain-containing protein [Candidatus Dependentiae bacterium]
MKYFHIVSLLILIYTSVQCTHIEKKPDHLPFCQDEYAGAHIEITSADDITKIKNTLNLLLARTGMRAIWLKLPLTLGQHVLYIKECGFETHHIDQTYISFVYKNGVDIPPHGMANLGAGGLVIKKDNDGNVYVLLTKPISRNTGFEVPGGGVELAENPEHAAKREVEEETGIIADILCPLGIVYRTNVYQGISTAHIYYLMQYKRGEIEEQSDEVRSTQWYNINHLWQDIKNGHVVLRQEVKQVFAVYLGKQKQNRIEQTDYRQHNKPPEKQNQGDTMHMYFFNTPHEEEK